MNKYKYCTFIDKYHKLLQNQAKLKILEHFSMILH